MEHWTGSPAQLAAVKKAAEASAAARRGHGHSGSTADFTQKAIILLDILKSTNKANR